MNLEARVNYKTIAICDFSYLLRVQYHARANDSGPNECAQHVLNQLSDWRRRFDHVIIALDAPPYWRSKLYEPYKGTRDRDDQSYPQICKWAKQRLVADGYSIAASPGFEADDILHSLSLRISEQYPATGIFLITGDKDASQCIFNQVAVWAPKPGGEWEVRTAEWVHKKWGINPEQVPLMLAIAGDVGDNIPGIKGIGEKGAAKLINEFKTIEGMRAAAAKAYDASLLEGAKPLAAFWKKFLEGAPRLAEWITLTTLRTDVPLDLEQLLTKQAVRPLVEDSVEYDPEDDGREPDWREVEKKVAQQQLLDPEVVISGPKASAVHHAAAPETASATARASTAHVVDTTGEPVAETPSGGKTAERSAVPEPKQPRKVDTVEDKTEAIVHRPPAPSWALQLQPTSVAETVRLCALLFNSRFLSQFGSERGVTAIVLMGRELGLGAMASLEMFHIVKDRPFPKAKGLRFLAERDPNCEWIQITDADENGATIETKHRKAGMLKYTYTIDRARKAGYLTGPNKHNWNTLTQEMLEARATSKAVNRWYSGSTFGMTSAEEMQDREASEEMSDE
jgi:5'-3' exonuclease